MRLSSKRLRFSFGGVSTGSHEAIRAAEERAVRRDLNTEELQLAGVLLQSVEKPAGIPILLFASLADSVGASNSVRRVTEAIREVRRGRVALVQLTANGDAWEQSAALDIPELAELRNWIATGTETASEIRWRDSAVESRGLVPTTEVRELFDRLIRCFDVICVDGGDVFASPNAVSAAPHCSGVVLMVQRDISTTRDVERCQNLMFHAGAKVLGFAFTEQE